MVVPFGFPSNQPQKGPKQVPSLTNLEAIPIETPWCFLFKRPAISALHVCHAEKTGLPGIVMDPGASAGEAGVPAQPFAEFRAQRLLADLAHQGFEEGPGKAAGEIGAPDRRRGKGPKTQTMKLSGSGN